MAESKPIRVRFAPSPTGFLHVGGLRTALYNYLFAKKNDGTFILRIEDTDRNRFVPGATESLVRTLAVMGLPAVEGVVLSGDGVEERGTVGPYIQSERLATYQRYAEELIAAGKAYRCFCSAQRLEEVRTAQAVAKRAPRYDLHCARLTAEESVRRSAAGEKSVIRFRISDDHADIRFTDLIRGEVKFSADTLDDFVLLKSDGYPTGVFAIPADDESMGITHVIKGEEWLPTTPKQILIYEAFGWTLPQFAHIPLLLNPDKSKLSKRQGDVAVEEYLKKGYLPEALINFVALLGWNPGQGSTQELFTVEELIRAFDLSSVHKGGAVFDLKKLDWMNGEYIKKMPLDELYDRMNTGGFLGKPLITGAPETMRSESSLKRVLAIEQERLAKLADIGEQNPFFFVAEPEYPKERLLWKENTPAAAKMMLEKAQTLLASFGDDVWLDRIALNDRLLEVAGDQRGDFLWPLRVALSGAERSPSPSDCAFVLGKAESIRRVGKAVLRLS